MPSMLAFAEECVLQLGVILPSSEYAILDALERLGLTSEASETCEYEEEAEEVRRILAPPVLSTLNSSAEGTASVSLAMFCCTSLQ